MKRFIFSFVDNILSSLWFVPAIFLFGAVILSLGMVSLDVFIVQNHVPMPLWMYTRSDDAARQILSTIATSLMTVVSVFLSITLVTLTLASSQYGHRLLRNFIADRGTQIVLGTVIATFLYCLVVLRSVREIGGEQVFIPHTAIVVAIVLTVINLGVLLYFINHIATTIQVERLLANIASELGESILQQYPEKRNYPDAIRQPQKTPKPAANNRLSQAVEQSSQFYVLALDEGYMKMIDYERLLNLAVQKDLLIKTEFRSGQFITRMSVIAVVNSANSLDLELTKQVQEAFIIGYQRSAMQDIEYNVEQLVEIALRALSPSINAPFTAIECLDRIGAGLLLLASRQIPSPYIYDQNRQLRLVTCRPIRYEGLVDAAFSQIRQFSTTVPAVTIRMLEIIAMVGQRARDIPEFRQALMKHAMMIERSSRMAQMPPNDLRDIQNRFQQVITVLGEPPRGGGHA